MGNTTVELVFEYKELFENIKMSVINFFPSDFFIKLTMVAMGLVVGYGVNRILTDDDKSKNKNVSK